MKEYRERIEEELLSAEEYKPDDHADFSKEGSSHAANEEYWQYPSQIGADEWASARATPDCIVEGYLYADVALLNAPGGTGKTTLILKESMHIALGKDLWGRKVVRPGPVLLITAEDSREMLVARMRSIADEMALGPGEILTVQDLVRISDVSGMGCKLTRVHKEMVTSSGVVEDIVNGCRDLLPVLIIIDPAVSFGVGESRVNDAEQGLIEVARELRRKLNCCVRYVHHTGKVNAITKSTSQYAGRGGSAFADGSRMVAILHSHDAEEWQELTGEHLDKDEIGLVLSLPKVSYAAPQEPIYVVRRGFTFKQLENVIPNKELSLEVYANQVLNLLTSQLAKGVFHNKKSLEGLATESNLTRQKLRDAVSLLLASGQVEERSKSQSSTDKGRQGKYLHPVGVTDRGSTIEIPYGRSPSANEDFCADDSTD
jgi:RecA-family ATPase